MGRTGLSTLQFGEPDLFWWAAVGVAVHCCSAMDDVGSATYRTVRDMLPESWAVQLANLAQLAALNCGGSEEAVTNTLSSCEEQLRKLLEENTGPRTTVLENSDEEVSDNGDGIHNIDDGGEHTEEASSEDEVDGEQVSDGRSATSACPAAATTISSGVRQPDAATGQAPAPEAHPVVLGASLNVGTEAGVESGEQVHLPSQAGEGTVSAPESLDAVNTPSDRGMDGAVVSPATPTTPPDDPFAAATTSCCAPSAQNMANIDSLFDSGKKMAKLTDELFGAPPPSPGPLESAAAAVSLAGRSSFGSSAPSSAPLSLRA